MAPKSSILHRALTSHSSLLVCTCSVKFAASGDGVAICCPANDRREREGEGRGETERASQQRMRQKKELQDTRDYRPVLTAPTLQRFRALTTPCFQCTHFGNQRLLAESYCSQDNAVAETNYIRQGLGHVYFIDWSGAAHQLIHHETSRGYTYAERTTQDM